MSERSLALGVSVQKFSICSVRQKLWVKALKLAINHSECGLWSVRMISPFALKKTGNVALQQGCISERSLFDEIFLGSRYFATLMMQTASARCSHQQKLSDYCSKLSMRDRVWQ